MSFRTDIMYENGKIKAVDHKTADTTKELPKVEGTDLLQSDAWGDSWRSQAGEPDNAIEALAQAQGEIARSFQSFMEVREKRNPDVTQSMHLKTLASDYDRALTRLANQSDRAAERAKSRLAEIENDFRQHVGWNNQDAQELRSAVRAMRAEDRSKFISEAVMAGDGQAMAAVLGAHPSLSGITADEQKNYRNRAMHKHTPKLLNLERTIEKAMKATSDAFLGMLERDNAVTAKDIREQYAAKEREAHEIRKRAVGDDGRWG